MVWLVVVGLGRSMPWTQEICRDRRARIAPRQKSEPPS